MKNRNILTEEEKSLLRKIWLNYDYSNKLTDEESAELEEKVGDHLTLNCLDDDYNPNKEGEMCYRILDKIDML